MKYQEAVSLNSESVTADGTVNVEVSLLIKLKPRERSELLLNLEDELCEKNPDIRIWHSSLGDKNSLRNLRGVVL